MTTRGKGVVNMLYINTDTVAVADSSVETTLDTCTIGAQVLQRDGDSVYFEYAGSVSGDAGVRIRIKFGATTIVDTDVIDPGITDWVFWGRVTRTGATTQKAYSFGGGLGLAAFGSVDCTEDLSTAIDLVMTGLGVLSTDLTKETAAVMLCGAPT